MSAQLPTMAENMAASTAALDALEAMWKQHTQDTADIIAENETLRAEIARMRVKLVELRNLLVAKSSRQKLQDEH